MKKLENIILHKIYNWPSLYYKNTYQESRLAVLQRLFLNSIKFDEKYDFDLYKDKKEKACKPIHKQKIKNGEKIYVICVTDKEFSFKVSQYYGKHSLDSIRKENNKFESEYLEEGMNYPLLYSEHNIKDKNELSDYVVEVWPSDEKYNPEPYPFCLYYANFVEINPYYKKYTYETIDQITVDELRESAKLLAKDIVDGIREVYQWALDFYLDDNRWNASRYYNYTLSDVVYTDWQNNLSNRESSIKFHKQYNIAFKEGQTVETFLHDVTTRNRNRYIDNCRKIVESFS